jgi:hypothetical protein
MKGLQIGGKSSVVLMPAEHFEPLADRLGELVAGEVLEIVEDFLGPGEGGRSPGHLQQDMEVIGHEGVGKDTDTTEPFAFPHQGEEMFHFGGMEDEPPVHDAGKTVVEAGRAIWGNLQSDSPHGGRRLITIAPCAASIFYKSTGF